MIKNLHELRAARISAQNAFDTFYKEANKPDAAWTNESQSRYDELTGVILALDGQIERERKVMDLRAKNAFDNDAQHAREVSAFDAKRGKTDARKIYENMARFGETGLNPEELAAFQNTMSTTTTTEGGYAVPSEVSATLIDKLAHYGGMRLVATIQKTSTGAALNYPTSDGTSEVGEILDQNTVSTNADIVFGTVALPVYMYSSKDVAVPFQLLQDAATNIESLVDDRLMKRLHRITNNHYTTGTGSSQPNGVVTAASVGKTGTTGQTLTAIYDDLVDLEESIDEAYLLGGSCAYMMPQSMRKVVRKIKDTAGRPIWLPSYDQGIVGGPGEQLLGHRLVINNSMAAPAANAKTIAFGDFSSYIIRDAVEITMHRFTDSAYTKKGQVGFLAHFRTGGNLVDTAAVKVYQHSAT